MTTVHPTGDTTRSALLRVLDTVVGDSHYTHSFLARRAELTPETLTEILGGDQFKLLTFEIFDQIMRACGAELLITWRTLEADE